MGIDKVGDGEIGDAGIGGEAYFAGAAVGVADGDAVSLDLGLKFAKSIRIDFRMGEAPVAGKTAAAYLLGDEHMLGTKLRQGLDGAAQSHLSHGAGDVDGNGGAVPCEDKSVAKEGENEFSRLVESHLADALSHAV